MVKILPKAKLPSKMLNFSKKQSVNKEVIKLYVII